MSEVSKHLVYLGLEVAGLLVVLASIDGMITLLKMLVGRSQRKRDHLVFLQRLNDYDVPPMKTDSWDADPFRYDEMPPVSSLTANHPTYRMKDADQIVIEARKGQR